MGKHLDFIGVRFGMRNVFFNSMQILKIYLRE